MIRAEPIGDYRDSTSLVFDSGVMLCKLSPNQPMFLLELKLRLGKWRDARVMGS